jgi:hypothetical protein
MFRLVLEQDRGVVLVRLLLCQLEDQALLDPESLLDFNLLVSINIVYEPLE